MDKEKLKSISVDYDKGLARCFGNAALYESLLKKFSEIDLMAQSEKLLASKAYNEAYAYLTELKNDFYTLGMDRLCSLADVLCVVLQNNQSECLPQAFAALSSAVKETAANIAL